MKNKNKRIIVSILTVCLFFGGFMLSRHAKVFRNPTGAMLITNNLFTL